MKKDRENLRRNALSEEDLDRVSGGSGMEFICPVCGRPLYPTAPMPSRATAGDFFCEKCKQVFRIGDEPNA